MYLIGHIGEDTRDLALELCEFHIRDRFARMQDYVRCWRKLAHMEPHRFAHTPFDAIAFDGFAEHTSRGKTDPRSLGNLLLCCPDTKEVAHRGREVFAAFPIDALVICVLAQAHAAKIGNFGHDLILF